MVLILVAFDNMFRFMASSISLNVSEMGNSECPFHSQFSNRSLYNELFEKV